MKKRMLIAFSGLKLFDLNVIINLFINNLSIYDFEIIFTFFRFILKISRMIQYILREITSNIPPANSTTYLGVSQIDSVDFLRRNIVGAARI